MRFFCRGRPVAYWKSFSRKKAQKTQKWKDQPFDRVETDQAAPRGSSSRLEMRI
jgi:hypothetical protein